MTMRGNSTFPIAVFRELPGGERQ